MDTIKETLQFITYPFWQIPGLAPKWLKPNIDVWVYACADLECPYEILDQLSDGGYDGLFWKAVVSKIRADGLISVKETEEAEAEYVLPPACLLPVRWGTRPNRPTSIPSGSVVYGPDELEDGLTDVLYPGRTCKDWNSTNTMVQIELEDRSTESGWGPSVRRKRDLVIFYQPPLIWA